MARRSNSAELLLEALPSSRSNFGLKFRILSCQLGGRSISLGGTDLRSSNGLIVAIETLQLADDFCAFFGSCPRNSAGPFAWSSWSRLRVWSRCQRESRSVVKRPQNTPHRYGGRGSAFMADPHVETDSASPERRNLGSFHKTILAGVGFARQSPPANGVAGGGEKA